MRRFLFLLAAGLCMGGTSALASPGPVAGASNGVSPPSIGMLDLMAGRASTQETRPPRIVVADAKNEGKDKDKKHAEKHRHRCKDEHHLTASKPCVAHNKYHEGKWWENEE